MTTRAKRRDDARIVAKAAARAGGGDLDTVAELAAVRRDLELARGWLKTYKTRLERTAMGLQFVSNAIIEGKFPEAQVAIRSLLSNDLAEARETVGNRRMALEEAVRVLEECRDRKWTAITSGAGPEDATPNEKGLFSYVGETNAAAHHAIEKIKTLAPESFGGEVAMTAPAGGRA